MSWYLNIVQKVLGNNVYKCDLTVIWLKFCRIYSTISNMAKISNDLIFEKWLSKRIKRFKVFQSLLCVC